MRDLLLVIAGGGVGAGGRFLLHGWASAALGTRWPWGTLAANLAGGFAMGLLAAWLTRAGADSAPWRLLIGTGLLGGFTTFSAFSLESVEMIARGAAGEAAGYALMSVAGSIAALAAGMAVMRGLA